MSFKIWLPLDTSSHTLSLKHDMFNSYADGGRLVFKIRLPRICV